MQRTTPHLRMLLSLLCALCLALAACSTTSIREQEPAEPVGQIIPTKLAIVHTGGIEGAYVRKGSSMGIAAVAGLARQLEDEGYEVLLFDSGNSLGGSALADLSNGETAVGFMNAAGYDAMALGGLELDLGRQTLSTRISQSDFTCLSANAYEAITNEPIASERRTYTLGDGRVIGVFGLTSPQAVAGIGPATARELALAPDNLIALAQRHVSELKAQGCRLVVCLSSLGFDEQGLPLANSVASQVEGLDLLLDASTGGTSQVTQINEQGEETLVIETSGRLQGASVITWSGGALTTKTYDASTAKKSDEQVLSLVTQSASELDRQLAKVITTSRDILATDRTLTGSCGLGQLAADAMLWEASHGLGTSPDAALLVASSLQGALPKGEVSYANALKVLPHTSSRLCTLEVTGSRLEAALQPLLTTTPTPSALMPQVSGVAFAEDQGTRSIAGVGGRTFSPSGTYTIVTCEGLLAADGALKDLATDATLTATDTSAGKALANYLEKECKDGIPERYFQ